MTQGEDRCACLLTNTLFHDRRMFRKAMADTRISAHLKHKMNFYQFDSSQWQTLQEVFSGNKIPVIRTILQVHFICTLVESNMQ
jgi:hypothetical protein